MGEVDLCGIPHGIGLCTLCSLVGTQEPEVCFSCLGTARFWADTVPEAVANRFAEQDRNVSEFRFSISMPMCYGPRQEFLRKLGLVVPNPKDSIKKLVAGKISQLSGLLESSTSGFSISIVMGPTNSDTLKSILHHHNLEFRASRKSLDQVFRNLDTSTLMGVGTKLLEGFKTEHVVLERILFCHDPIFIAGKYIKDSRNLSQSPWIKGKTSGSVSEIIGTVLKHHTGSDGFRFISAGREDADVRMLGNGRPCMFEMLDPKILPSSAETWSNEIQQNSEGQVAFHSIQVVDGSLAKEALANPVQKTYRCCVWTGRNVDQIDERFPLGNIELLQKTPIRVMHRRCNKIRRRMIHNISLVEAGVAHGTQITIDLVAQSGTYIKEFVHGDFGRTLPSLGDLMVGESNAFEVLSLDVLSIHTTWPPKESIINRFAH